MRVIGAGKLNGRRWFPLSAAAVMVLLLLSSGCTLEPFHPSVSVPAEIGTEPNYVCSGDPVNVIWDLNPPQHEDFCEYPKGGYDELKSCADNSDCPDGGRCYDGICCASPVPFGECGSNCRADGQSTIDFAPSGLRRTEPQASGRIAFSPEQTTAITLNGEWGPPTTAKGPATARVVVVDEPPLENLTMGFPFGCVGSGFGWGSFDLATANVLPSSRVLIDSVKNTSGYQIRLSDGVHPAVILDAGAPPTTAFNGPLSGTIWSASLTSIATVGLPMPRCTPLDQSDPYPDLSIEVTLACESNSP